MNDQNHYLVVGGGVGGLCVAYHLLLEGHTVTLIDRGENKSSVVAAGLINPLVFRRMTKSWRADELIPYASRFYQDIERETGSSFFHPITIRRFFSSDQEKNFWMEKQHLPDFTAYMEPLTEEDLSFSELELKNDFGSARVKNAYWVNTPVFLSSLRSLIATRARVLTEEFEFSLFDAESRTYRGKVYSGIIFCTGYENVSNPLFSSLPVQTTKGEVLTAESDALPTSFSVNRKCFVLPTGDHRFRIGATYTWETTDTTPTPEGREEILEKLKALTSTMPLVIDHQAGIRPTSPDRRPIIGRHPQYPGIYLFNGLGTKGYMIAPLLSLELVESINGKKELTAEVELNRFLK